MKKLIIFLILSLSIFSATTKTTTSKIQEVKLNETITIPDFCEFTVLETNFAKIISPSNPNGYYSYYESKDKEGIYFNAIVSVKNLQEESNAGNSFISIQLVYANKYKYSTFSTIEEADGSDFKYSSITYIDPLRKAVIYNLVEVPLEVSIDTQKPLYLIIKANEKEFKYIVR